ncbi:MAG TPA: hypothetical protein VNK46_12515 [Nitrospiraceae bacterium]|nr:hypothetical protein [Nitrospiraceae bacterium]
MGNQLFQYFIAQAEAASRRSIKLFLIPYALTRYSTVRSLEIMNLIDTASSAPRVLVQPADLLARLRLPKIAKKLTGKEWIMCLPGYGTLLDGYFQEFRFFQSYDAAQLSMVLSDWRKMLAAQGLLRFSELPQITHVRLGDFFKSRPEAWQFAHERIATLDGSTDLITDQEDIVAEVLTQISLPFEVQLRRTIGFSPWKIFQLLTRYKRIVTNGSSLAFWAAVLARADFSTSNLEHMKIWKYLVSVQ